MVGWGGGGDGQEWGGNMANWAGAQSKLSGLEMGGVGPSSSIISKHH